MNSRQTYIQSLVPAAKAATAGTRLFPETLVSQLILESGYTPSKLAKEANNWFGIKSGNSWQGKVISAPTSEYNSAGVRYRVPGSWKVYPNRLQALQAGEQFASLFRVYASQTASFSDWVKFLQTNQRYSKAGVFTAKTPVDQFKALQTAGYATDPLYAKKLENIYNTIKNFFF